MFVCGRSAPYWVTFYSLIWLFATWCEENSLSKSCSILRSAPLAPLLSQAFRSGYCILPFRFTRPFLLFFLAFLPIPSRRPCLLSPLDFNFQLRTIFVPPPTSFSVLLLLSFHHLWESVSKNWSGSPIHYDAWRIVTVVQAFLPEKDSRHKSQLN